MKFLGSLFGVLVVPLLCLLGFVGLYVTFVEAAIPQMPAPMQRPVAEWLNDIPQDSEDVGVPGGSAPAYAGAVGWGNYVGPGGDIHGLPLIGPIKHWSQTYDKPLLGCHFHDPAYVNHTGDDFPVNEGTPVHATIAGQVVWADYNGPWGNLVVVQNGDYQVWTAHLSAIYVVKGQIVGYGDVVGASGNTGNSSGPHVHYGIKHRTENGSLEWLDPEMFFSPGEFIPFGCSD